MAVRRKKAVSENQAFGARLKTLMSITHMTHDDLAEVLDVTRPYTYDLTAGRNLPAVQKLFDLVDHLASREPLTNLSAAEVLDWLRGNSETLTVSLPSEVTENRCFPHNGFDLVFCGSDPQCNGGKQQERTSDPIGAALVGV